MTASINWNHRSSSTHATNVTNVTNVIGSSTSSLRRTPQLQRPMTTKLPKIFVHFKSSKIKVSWNGILPKTIPVHTLTTFLVCDDENEAREILEEKLFWDTEVAEVQSFSMTNNRKSSKEGNGIPPWPRYIPKKLNQKVNINININTLKQDIKIKSFSVEMYQKRTTYYLFVKKNSKFFNKIVFLNHYKLNYIRRQCPFYVKKK